MTYHSNNILMIIITVTSDDNERDGVSNHHRFVCLMNRLFQAHIKENIEVPRHWPLWGEFTSDRWIPPSNAENVSIWWRHHVYT